MSRSWQLASHGSPAAPLFSTPSSHCSAVGSVTPFPQTDNWHRQLASHRPLALQADPGGSHCSLPCTRLSPHLTPIVVVVVVTVVVVVKGAVVDVVLVDVDVVDVVLEDVDVVDAVVVDVDVVDVVLVDVDAVDVVLVDVDVDVVDVELVEVVVAGAQVPFTHCPVQHSAGFLHDPPPPVHMQVRVLGSHILVQHWLLRLQLLPTAEQTGGAAKALCTKATEDRTAIAITLTVALKAPLRPPASTNLMGPSMTRPLVSRITAVSAREGTKHGDSQVVKGCGSWRRPHTEPGACRPGSAGSARPSRVAATEGNASAQQPVARMGSRRRRSPAGGAAPGLATPPAPPAGAPARRARRSPPDGPSASRRPAPAATGAAPGASARGRRTASTRPA